MVLRIAHRGASGYHLENTIESFEKAIKLGCDMIELDVRTTKDGVPVIIHDSKINRTTNGKGRVKKMTFAKLRKFRLKNGEKISTLYEVLTKINGRCMVNVELKYGSKNHSKVINTINKANAKEYVIISSFFMKHLKKVRKLCPDIKIGVLRKYIVPYKRVLRWCKELGAFSVHPYYSNKALSRNLVNKFRDQGIKVYVWDVDDPKEIARLKKIGVDGIMSNFPERV